MDALETYQIRLNAAAVEVRPRSKKISENGHAGVLAAIIINTNGLYRLLYFRQGHP